jgi:hypothetical protein
VDVGLDWEVVKAEKGTFTATYVPNPDIPEFSLIEVSILQWTIIRSD